MATDTPANEQASREDTENTPELAAGKEHRSVTVLMVDIVGSTDLMEKLGHEGYASVLQGFHSMCAGIVQRRGGLVSEYLGDGVLCFFGLPRASEDDAAHAVKAALEIVGEMDRNRSDTAPLEARLGISSGSVMINANTDMFGTSAVGTCVHRAARLEALAQPNTVLICDDTRRLIGRTFQLKERGVHQLRGISQPEPVYQAVKTRTGLTTRFQSLRGHLAGDLIGRQAELDLLHALFDKAAQNGGRAVTITADAGLGKSRLIQTFLQSPQTKGAPSFVLQCSPEHTRTSLYPVVRYLEWIAGLTVNDDAAMRMSKLKRLIEKVWGLGPNDTEVLLDLINPFEASTNLDQSESVKVRRDRALGKLADQIFKSVKGRGTFVVVFEDVHWLDPTSAQLLDLLLARANAHSVLIILSTRAEPPYGEGLPEAPPMRLLALSKMDARTLAQQILGHDAPTDLLVEKSEGVPLILQEYAEIMLETGGEVLKATHVPLTLTSIIQSKLDRLDDETRRFARAGSALGRSFDPKLIARLAGQDLSRADTMAKALHALNLTYRCEDTPDDDRITFTHALIRDAVYGNMPGAERRAIHDAIAEAYLTDEALPPLEDHVLADHLAKAERNEEAAEHYMAAALTAAKKGAAAEALAYLEAGLDAVELLPPGERRDHLEMRLLAVKGPTLMVTRGPGNEEFGRIQARAMELVERLDMLEDMLPVVFYTAEHAWAVADLDRAETMADAILMLDRRKPSDVAHLAGNLLKGMVAWHRGDNSQTLESLERVIARYDMEKHKALYAHFIKEFGVFSQFYAGLTRTIQGAFDDGLALAEGAMSLSKKLNFPHERGFALLARFNTAMLRDDVVTADLASREALIFSTEQGFPEFVAMAQFAQGWCQARRGQTSEGVALMESGFEAWRQTGFTCWQALFAAILAPYQVTLGRLSEAADLVDYHLDQIDSTGEEQCRAPLLLARAVIKREQGELADAMSIAKSAYVVAQKQGAVLWQGWIDETFALSSDIER
ncbi:MAG: adenylate/guanylate cyclase domain-containing protein [Paracoccaceae bacterium]|nr:adenylate/guanylate cyclase domain-containing protein [Paracoccaceae bacterium]